MSRSAVSGLLVLGVFSFMARVEAEPAETSKAPTPAGAKAPASVVPLAPVTAPMLKIEQLTKADFDKLPESALLDIQGRRLPKSEFLAERKRALDAVAARLQGASATELAGFQDEIRRLDGSVVEAENAKVRAEVAKLRADSGKAVATGDLDALRRAAIDLRSRYRSASLAERIEIEKQAADLLRKVREMKK